MCGITRLKLEIMRLETLEKSQYGISKRETQERIVNLRKKLEAYKEMNIRKIEV